MFETIWNYLNILVDAGLYAFKVDDVTRGISYSSFTRNSRLASIIQVPRCGATVCRTHLSLVQSGLFVVAPIFWVHTLLANYNIIRAFDKELSFVSVYDAIRINFKLLLYRRNFPIEK